MPLRTVQCCKSDTPVPIDECLEHAASRENTCPFTYELLASMYATNQDRDYISTTTLISKCLRQEFITRGEPYTIEPADMWARFRGTMYHGQLEQHAAPGSIEEARFHVDLPDLGHLSGSPDLIDVQRGILYDYKTNRENPRWDKVWPDHEAQLNVNRWLVDHAEYVEYGDGTPIILRDDRGEPTPALKKFVPMDWQALVIVYLDDKGAKPITVTESVQVPKKNGQGTKAARVPAIWSDEKAEAFIRENYAKAKAALVDGELPDIPPGFEGQGHVLCGYCPVRSRCRELELQDLVRYAVGKDSDSTAA